MATQNNNNTQIEQTKNKKQTLRICLDCSNLKYCGFYGLGDLYGFCEDYEEKRED